MKVRTLQLKKAISAALFVLLLSVVGMKNALAQNLVATLKHGDDISFYYGANALVNAHEDAETGDIITLSSGSFAPTTITKAITLRGAGCVEDTISGVHPTVINAAITFDVGDTENYLTVEGIYFSAEDNNWGGQRYKELHNPRFIRCNFNSYMPFRSGSYTVGNSYEAQFTNCMFKYFNFGSSYNTTLINCVVWNDSGLDNNNATVTAFNSIIRLGTYAYALTAYNCIFTQTYYRYIQNYSVTHDCIAITNGYNTDVFQCPNYNCMTVATYSDVFETFEGDFSYEEAYILNEEIATEFLGNDGTEVGIHGGIMPYESRPSYQIVRQYNVPRQSDNEGHLNVGIEVYSEDE